jgi:hypothetical protein
LNLDKLSHFQHISFKATNYFSMKTLTKRNYFYRLNDNFTFPKGLFSLITLLTFLTSAQAQMGGTYTVNPSAAASATNFQTILAANTALQTSGINAPVTIDIYSGTYVENFIISTTIAGTSATNTVTFKSFLNDSLTTIIQGKVEVADNSFLIFRKLKVAPTYPSYEFVKFTGSCNNITLSNNTILTNIRWQSGVNFNVLYNDITGGIMMNGATNKTGMLIKGNTIRSGGADDNLITHLLHFDKVEKPVVTDNIFRDFSHYFGLYDNYSQAGFYKASFHFTNSTDTFFLLRNKFLNCNTDRLIEVRSGGFMNGLGNQLAQIEIYNNFFSTVGMRLFAVTSFASYNQLPQGVNFAFNNVRVNGITTFSFGVTQSIFQNIKNNSFANTNGGKAVSFVPTANANFNNYYTTGTVLIENLSGGSFNNLNAYQTAGNEPNAISVNPNYYSVENLHAQHPLLVAAGTPFPTTNPILKDIDDDNRNALTPCIGADEFQPIANDVTILSIQTQTRDFEAATAIPLSIKLKNKGAAVLNQVQVNMSIDGVAQTPYAWTGSLAYDDSTAAIVAANLTYPMLKNSKLVVWTTNPNNAPDQVPADDTAKINSIIPFTKGTFTLGGAMPDFNNFKHLDSILVLSGMNGAVAVNVRNGTYAQQATFRKVRGRTATDSLLIKGENNDSTLVTLAFLNKPSSVYNPSTGLNDLFIPATLYLDSAKYITFRHLTLQNLNAQPSDVTNVVLFGSDCGNIRFDKCVITGTGNPTYNNHDLVACAYNENMNSDAVSFTNNTFKTANDALYLQRNPSSAFTNLVIKNNKFTDLRGEAVNVTTPSVLIENNIVGPNPSVCGFFFGGICYAYSTNILSGVSVTAPTTGTTQVNINNNKIFTEQGVGIRFEGGTATNPTRIYNNMVSINQGNALFLNNAKHVEVYHNTFSDSSNAGNILVNLANITSVNFRNNLLVKGLKENMPTFSGALINITSAADNTNLTSNYNAFFNNDPTKIIQLNGTPYTFNAWKALGKDANSKQLIDNIFIQIRRDLHVDNTKAGAAEAFRTGTPIAYITKDIDDSLRHVSTPCIGADEFSLQAIDGGITAVTNGNIVYPTGVNALTATIKNFGENALTAATINWSVDGVAQPSFAWSGNLTTGNTEGGVAIGSFDFNLPKQYTIKVWTSIGGDNNAANDTTTIKMRPALCGTYTIGGSTPDFATPKLAINYLKESGVSCAVIFNIRNGTYTESDTIPNILGTSASNTVTFQSESGDSSLVKISQNNDNASVQFVVLFTGGDFVNFKKITIQKTPVSFGSYNNLVGFTNQSTNNSFSGCLFTSIPTSAATLIQDNAAVAATIQGKDTMNSFIGNRFVGGKVGIKFNTAIGIKINNNIFEKFVGESFNNYYRQIDLSAAKNIEIVGNVLDSARAGHLSGIYVGNPSGVGLIKDNKIIKRKGGNGIEINFGGNNITSFIIANNMISMDSLAGNGIYTYNNVKGVSILHNTFNISSPSTPAIYSYFSNDTIINNNIVVRGTNSLGINASQYSANGLRIRNNNIFKTGTTTFAYINNTSYATLATLQASAFGTGTVSIDPNFTTPINLYTSEIGLRAGFPLANVPTDIDGKTRSATVPSMGANEIIVTLDDAGSIAFNAPLVPFAAGTQTVQMSVRNFGVNPLSSVTINWSVNGILQTPYSATGLSVVQSTNSAPLSIGTYNFVINTPYTLRFWTTNPNSATDANTANDTLLITNIYPALNGVYTIGGTTPDFLNFTQARTNLHAGGMLGNVTFNVRDGKYFEQLTLDSIPNQGNNTVTFQSENLDNTKVYLSYSGVQNDGIYGAVEFKKAKNITIRHISMGVKLPLVFGSTSIANSTTLNSVVALRGGNINIQLLDNQLIDSTNSGSATGVGVKLISNKYGGFNQNYSSALGSNDSLITVSNNKFIQVYQSNTQTSVVELEGAASQLNSNPFYIVLATLKKITFTNNTFDIKNLAKTGLSLYNIETAVVTNNKVQGNAILGATDNILIDKNTFNHASYNQTAVTLKSSAGRLAGKPFVFSNNMVKTDVVGFFNGSYVNNTGVLLEGDRIKMAHNTVATSDTGYTTGYTFGAAIKFLNSTNQSDTLLNNIIFNSNQGYLFLGNLPTNCVANNNLLFSSRISPNATTLAQWQSANVGKDVNSITGINPYFKGANDLHASNILIKTMPQLAGFTTDIDGNLRGSTVCVGADEFTQPVNDAVIVDYAPRKVFPEGNNAITVDIYNNGTAPITSLQFNVALQNFVQDNTIPITSGSFTYNFNGNIPSGATQTINLGNLTIPISRNILKINNVLTNGVADEVTHTDTLQNDMYYCGLNGTYTFRNANIFSTTTSFNSFDLVRKQLKFGGVYGPSNLDLIAGLHNGNFLIDSLPNRGALSPLTIRSANNDSINTGIINSTGQAIDIRNASYVTLQKLKIENTSGGLVYQSSLTYLYRSHHIKVENCYLKNLNTGGTDFLTSGSIGTFSVKDLVIKNNYFDTSAVGIILFSNYNDSTTNVLIENNIFNKQREAGIYAYTSKSVSIKKNQFFSTSPFFNPTDVNKRYMAINLYIQIGKNEILNNKIHLTQDGIGINGSFSNSISNTNDSTIIANNMITIGSTNESFGINLNTYSGGLYEMLVYHNSINNLSTSNLAVAFKMTSNHAKVRNNIFYNKNNGKAADITKSGTHEQNYNLLYSGGATLATVNGSNYTTLAALSSGASLDYNSVTGNPLFVSDTDLHADGSTANNNGIFTTTQIVKEDFDSETRNISMPDIGADEFTLPNYGSVALEGPLSSCSHTTTESVKVWVKNFGTTVRNRIPMAYRFNGGTIVRDTANVTLAPNDSTLFTFTQTANLATPIDYNFEVFTEYRGDSLPANDTIKVLVATTSSNNILPYYTGFEGSANGWYSNGQNTSWKWGVVYSGVIDSAANGLNAWKTNLTGPHRNGEVSYLYSPCFDLTTLTQDPTMNFSITYQLDNNDKAWLEISGDGGTSWSKLGATGDGMGWYNASGNVWSGVQQGWTNAKHLIPLSILSDKSKTRFRFVLQTNNSVVQDGFGVDDISIYTTVNKPIANTSGTFTGLTGTSTGSATFVPVNDASGNRLIEVNDNGQNLGTITVDVNQNPSGTPTLQNGQYYLGRNFVIKVQNAPTSPVKVRLFITQAEFDALKAADPTLDQVRSLSVVKYNGSIENTSLADNGSLTKLTISPAQISKVPYLDGYFLEFSVSSFSEFYITNGNFLGSPLPLQLTSFTGQQNKGSVLLNWETTQEKDMSHFEVEVSSDGADFVKFDLIKAKNKPYKTTYYAADYSKWASNIKYYRLKMVGIDGKYEYSRVLSFNHKQSIAVSIYPNPAHETVVIDGGKNFKQIQVVDALGKIVRTFAPKENNEYALDGLNTGVYFIRLVNGLEMQVHKLVIE